MQSYGYFTLQHLSTKIWKGKILESFQLTEKCILTPDSCSPRKFSQLWGFGGLCISKNEENTIFVKFTIFFVIFEKFDKFVLLSGTLLLLRTRWMKYLADKTVMLCRCDKTMKSNHQLCYYIMLDTKNSNSFDFWKSGILVKK